jgi:threonine/homoserine/homoserine lactone efflux protein
MILTFFSAFFIAFSGAMMPGSLLAYTLRKSLSDGPKAGFFIAAGHAVLELLLIIMIFLGFGRILQLDAVTMLISLIGGAILIYMGADMIRGSVRNTVKVNLEDSGKKTGGMFASGIIISATNPFFIIWWSVVGLGFILQSYEAFGISGIAIYYTGHILADFLWYCFVSILVGTTRRFIRDNLYRIIIACLGVITIFFGVRFIYTALFK